MKIRFVRFTYGRGCHYLPGESFELPDDEAKGLVANGSAVIETAVPAVVSETAEAPNAKKASRRHALYAPRKRKI